ncbi:MAG: hypothetical protein O2856_15565, partial [Planctomycetota bacterium]|nr:hypothetical protein [Planctomycetota bacterium]
MKNRIVFCSLLVTIAATSSHADSLPGARPVIDAANYNSLQAAFDAIPEEGGLVRLPAGNFEISEPLKLRRGDVRIEGVGSATNIINTNTEGRSALIVQHTDGATVKKAERLWRVNLSNFRITGNEKSGHGIEAIQIEEI